jgi:hypothetical protein
MPTITQIKLFKGWFSETVKDENNLEKLVNTWLSENPTFEILDIKFNGHIESYQSRAGNSLVASCLVIYRTEIERAMTEEEREAAEKKRKTEEEVANAIRQVLEKADIGDKSGSNKEGG